MTFRVIAPTQSQIDEAIPRAEDILEGFYGEIVDEITALFEKTWAGWDNKPRIYWERDGNVVRIVFEDSHPANVWEWLDKGVNTGGSPYALKGDIVPRNAQRLRFLSEYTPSTSSASLESGVNTRGGAVVYTSRVSAGNWSIEPRNFTEKIEAQATRILENKATAYTRNLPARTRLRVAASRFLRRLR